MADEIRIAQIGCGHWGKNLTRNFSELGALAAVVDNNPDTAKRMADMYGVKPYTFEDALADPQIDGVALATPAVSHAEFAIRALEAGKHVFVEKPLALRVVDAAEVLSVAEKSGKVLMVGHLLQYHPIFSKVRDMVAQGTIGKLRYVYSNRLSLGKFRTEENVLWSFAPHDLSMILSLAGEEPDSVSAQGMSYVTPGIADWANVQMRFPGGLRGHVQTSWIHPYKDQRLVVVGEDGMIEFADSNPDWDSKLMLYQHAIDRSGPVPEPVRAEGEKIAVAKGEPLKAECQHFIDCCASNASPRANGAEGLAVLRVLEKAEDCLAQSLRG